MINLPAPYAAHLLTRSTKLAHALLIERQDGMMFGYTSHDRPVPIGGVQYLSSPGLDVGVIETSSGLQVGNLEMTTLRTDDVFTTRDIRGEVWSDAKFTILRYNWSNIANGTHTLLTGTFGQIHLKQVQIVVELRDLRHYLTHEVGKLTSELCGWRLGSTTRANGGLCKVNLAPFTFSMTVSAVTSNQVFGASALVKADQYFEEGLVQWLTGENAGVVQKISRYIFPTYYLARPMLGDIAIGDTASVIKGCNKTRPMCLADFDNVINFGGEPDLPTTDSLIADMEVDV